MALIICEVIRKDTSIEAGFRILFFATVSSRELMLLWSLHSPRFETRRLSPLFGLLFNLSDILRLFKSTMSTEMIIYRAHLKLETSQQCLHRLTAHFFFNMQA